MKKNILTLCLVFSTIFLISCKDKSVEKETRKTNVAEYASMTKLSELIRLQAKYPEQEEFSLKYYSGIKSEDSLPSEGDLKSQDPSIKKYMTPLGELSGNIEKEGDYLIFNLTNLGFNAEEIENKKFVCNYYLRNEREDKVLYGYNLNNKIISERIGELDSEEWINLICNSYLSEKDNVLYIALRLNPKS